MIPLDGSPHAVSDRGSEENTFLGGHAFQGQTSGHSSSQSPYPNKPGSINPTMQIAGSINDPHVLDPYLNTYTQGINVPSTSSLLSSHHMDLHHPPLDTHLDTPLAALHPGMLDPQSPNSYYSYPPTGAYPFPAQPMPFSQERQPTPNDIDYAWQALMTSIGVQNKPT